LEFSMGPKPSAWGTGKNAAPSSITKDDKVPTPRHDLTVPSGGTALLDNTSTTEATFESVDLPVTEPGRAVQYTLTSSDHGKTPTGWVLQGSPDGEKWRDLDRRSGESFNWDKQTRVFSVRTPGTYEHYRLVPDGAKATLAEVELLG